MVRRSRCALVVLTPLLLWGDAAAQPAEAGSALDPPRPPAPVEPAEARPPPLRGPTARPAIHVSAGGGPRAPVARVEPEVESAARLDPPRDPSSPARHVANTRPPPRPPPVATPFTPDARGSVATPVRIDVRPTREWVGAADVLREDLAFVPELVVSASEARFLVEGELHRAGRGVELRLRLTEPDRPGTGALDRAYRGGQDGVRHFVHGFADEVVAALTGRPASFLSQLVFARRIGPGHKHVFAVEPDGEGLRRLTSEGGVAMLPGPDDDAVWYTVVTRDGSYITNTRSDGRPVIDSSGDDIGPVPCGQRVLFTSTREGNSEIHSAAPDGSDVRRLTDNPAIDVSPACAPDGRIAFVSDRSGSPQIYLMDADGGHVVQVTDQEGESQTPAFCSDGASGLMAFTGVHRGTRIFVHNMATGQTRQVSPEGKDPAFSPDCRMLAFATSEGIVVTRLDGQHARVVLRGPAETVRWWLRAPTAP